MAKQKSEPAKSKNSDRVDFVIITALAEERDAVLALLEAQKLDKDETYTYYQASILSNRQDKSIYKVIISCPIKMGPVAAATHAVEVVNRWKPLFVLLVGIACGVRGEVEHGDVLIASQVADYTLGKQKEGKRLIRWESYQASPSLLDSVNNIDANWSREVKTKRPRSGETRWHQGVVVSGGDVVADDNLIAGFAENWPKLIGIEMEGGGVAAAVQQTTSKPGFLMIKAVSDFGKDKHDKEVERWRDYAYHSAAAFAVSLIKSGPVSTGSAMALSHPSPAGLGAVVSTLEAVQRTQETILNLAIQTWRQENIDSVLRLYFQQGTLADQPLVELNLPSTQLPPRVSKIARRVSTVRCLASKVTSPGWLSIHGDFGTGKSHLASLLAEVCGGILFGLNMREVPARNAASSLELAALDSSISTLLASEAPGIVLLDDLPDFDSQGRLEQSLASFANLVLANKRILISTGRRSLPGNLWLRFIDNFHSQLVPVFTGEEAHELFAAHKIDETILSRLGMAELSSICGGHPMLLTALARHLVANNGELEKSLLDALVAGSHRQAIDLEIARSVFATVESEACRMLLYRLASAAIPLTLEEIRVLARVNPSIPEPSSCVARLDGLWLRRVSDDHFISSPLAIPLASEISPAENGLLHNKLAEIIFKRGRLSVTEFRSGIRSFLLAGQRELAVVHVLQACRKWEGSRRLYHELGVLLFFPLKGFDGINLGLEVMLRGYQVLAAVETKLDPKEYIDRIEAISANVVTDLAAALFACGATILNSSPALPASIATWAAALCEKCGAEYSSPGQPISEVWNSRLRDVHIIQAGCFIQTWNEIEDFLIFLGSLGDQPFQQLLGNELFREQIELLVLRPISEAQSAEAWTDEAKSHLIKIEQLARALNLRIFAPYAVAGRLIVLGEFEGKVDQMLELGAAEIIRFADDPVAVSVIECSLGLQLFSARRFAESIPYFYRGLQERDHIIGIERFSRLAEAFTASWSCNCHLHFFCDELESMQLHWRITDSETLCRLNSMLALAKWRIGFEADACEFFERAAIEHSKIPTAERAKHLGIGLMRSIEICAFANIPRDQRDLSLPDTLTEVEVRCFSNPTDSRLAVVWDENSSFATLNWLLANLTAAVGHGDFGIERAVQARRMAIENSNFGLLKLLRPWAVSEALRGGDWEDALKESIAFARERNDNKLAIWLLSCAVLAELSSKVLAGDKQGRTDLESFADFLENLSGEVEVGLRAKAIGDIVRLASFPEMPTVRLREQFNTLKTDEITIGLFCFRKEIDLHETAARHLSTLLGLDGVKHLLGPIVGRYSKSVCEYWLLAFRSARFKFSFPAKVDNVFVRSLQDPPLRRVRVIIGVVLDSLSVKISVEQRRWLALRM